MPQGIVYILASKRNGTLYIGVTNNHSSRVHAHREGRGSAFTKKYNVKMLVWHETYDMVTDAIQRETSLKRWPRKWKLALIKKDNPNWDDLYETICEDRRHPKNLSITALEAANQHLQWGKVWVAGSSPAMKSWDNAQVNERGLLSGRPGKSSI